MVGATVEPMAVGSQRPTNTTAEEPQMVGRPSNREFKKEV